MDVVFRTDAAIEIGLGHVMRCLTLADGLALRGHRVQFVCREHAGNATRHIAGRGYPVKRLPLVASHEQAGGWLGASQSQDASETMDQLGGQVPHWIVTDHYAIGSAWERTFRSRGSKVVAVDDLADRDHDCDILLDQTLGRREQDYRALVPADATILTGANFAMLRPEFARLRLQHSRPPSPMVERILVSLGGADAGNLTSLAMDAIDGCRWPIALAVDIVLGASNPWVDVVRQRASQSLHAVRVMVDVADMATLMSDADLSIGTAGTTSWERCCLGLPSVLVVVADNQMTIARSLVAAGATVALHQSDHLVEDMIAALKMLGGDKAALQDMAERATALVDGDGCARVVKAMEDLA